MSLGHLLLAVVLVHSGGNGVVDYHVGNCTGCKYSTIPSALVAVRSARASNPKTPFRLVVHEGWYPPVHLDPALDSGTAASPLVIQGYSSLAVGGGAFPAKFEQPPVISASTVVPQSMWRAMHRTSVGSTLHSLPATVVVANISKLGLSREDFGSLPENGNAVDGCDQLTELKMQLHHKDDQSHAGLVFARYPNLDNVTGGWRFLHAAKQRSVAGGKGLAPDPKDAARVRGWTEQAGGAWVHG